MSFNWFWLLEHFSCQMYFSNSVLFSYFSYLKSLLWSLYLSLKVVPANLKLNFSSSFELLTMSAWYITDRFWHSPLSGHLFFTLQLHPNDCCFGDNVIVVGKYNRTNVPQAAITYLDCTSIKNFMHGIILWKMFQQ